MLLHITVGCGVNHPMAIYAQLFSHTTTGKQDIDTIPTEVFPKASELVEELGGDDRGLYYGNMGKYDGVAITEFPDEESAEKFRLTVEQGGTHHIENYEVFEAEEYFELIEETTD